MQNLQHYYSLPRNCGFRTAAIGMARIEYHDKLAKKVSDGHRSIAVYLFEEQRQRFMGTVGVPERYPLPTEGQIVEIRYLYWHPGPDGKLIQAKYFGQIRDDIARGECSVSQLKLRADESEGEQKCDRLLKKHSNEMVVHSMRSLKRRSLEMRMHRLFLTTDAKWNRTELAPMVVPRSSEKPICSKLRRLKEGCRYGWIPLSIPLKYDIIEDVMLSEKPLPSVSVKRLSLDAIDVENDAELDALTAQVLAAGNKIAESERAEMIRKGIIDEHGNLLKTELPEDMRKDADRDFGG
jgi:hypothetical protein